MDTSLHIIQKSLSPSHSPLPRRQASSLSCGDGSTSNEVGSSSKNLPLAPSLTLSTFDIEQSSPTSSRRVLQNRQKGVVLTSYLRAACHHVKSQWTILVAGQVLSFLVACAGAAQATLSFDCGLSAPTLSLGLFYACLACCLIPICRESCLQKQRRKINQDLELQYETASIQRQQSKSVSTNLTNGGVAEVIPSKLGSAPLSPAQRQRSAPQTMTLSSSSASLTAPLHTFLFGLIPLSSPAYVYFGMAVIDVYANYFTVLAFSYTTITSVTLLDALAIPSAMILSRAFLKREYRSLHLLGAFLCMVGVILNVFQDYEDEINETNAQGDDQQNTEFPHRVKGDLIAVAGGVLFGASSVVGEIAVRNVGGPNEYIGMLGFFATFICIIQTIAIEYDDIAEFVGSKNDAETKCTQGTARVILITFVIINVVNYIGRAWFLQVSEAAFLNLSLLTGDMWSVVFSVVAEKIAPHAFFYIALSITLSGVFVYEMAPSPVHGTTLNQPHHSGAQPVHADDYQGDDDDLHKSHDSISDDDSAHEE